jgi:hypothetical protein
MTDKPTITTLLDHLKMAHFKIGEMLRVGDFDEDHRDNFERSLLKIKEAINTEEPNA